MKLRKLGIAVFALSSAGALAATSPTSVDSQQSSNPGYTSSQSQLTSETDNAQVSQIQQMLADKGYKVGTVDGQMGTKTKSALKQFQQSQGLQASGRIDTQTLAALGTTSATSSSTSQQGMPQQGMPEQGSSQQGMPQQGSSGFSPQSPDTTPATTSPATSSPGMSGTKGKAPGG